jgi:hypothetical protein
MNEITIKEKLTLMREGHSLESINEYINEAAKDAGDIFLESVVSDIGYIIESDNDDVKKTKSKKVIEWLIKKIDQLIAFIKEKYLILKSKIFKGKGPNGVAFQMHEKVFEGKDGIDEILNKLSSLASGNGIEKFNNDEVDSDNNTLNIKDKLLKELLGLNYNGKNIHHNLRETLLGDIKTYKFTEKSYSDKVSKASDDCQKQQQELIKILERLKQNLHSGDHLPIYNELLYTASQLTAVLKVNGYTISDAIDKMNGITSDNKTDN